MTRVGVRPWSWRAKRADLLFCSGILVVGAFLVYVAAVAVPSDVTAIRVLLWYTVYAIALTAALGLAVVLTSSLPAVGKAQVDGREAEGVQAWPWQRRYDVAVDVGLVVALGTVAAIGVAAGNGWAVPSLFVAAVAAWLLGRLVVVALGRRREEAVWLTDTHVVHDSTAGRVSVARSQVVDVRPVNGWVFVEFDGAAQRALAPRPWRRQRRLHPQMMLVDAGHMGPTADELVAWLRAALEPDRERSETTPARRPNRWWRKQ